tara:strand:+ start:2216 stop:2500 length:285 start_codon:yes stop_codon:yes gene_type:complete
MERIKGFEERIIYIDGDSVACSGDNNDHPKVYLRIPHDGHYVVCGYCDIKYARKDPDIPEQKVSKEKAKEYGGPKEAEPTRYGTWEYKGREIDF